MSDKLTEYYEKAFVEAGEDGSIYNPMTILEKAGHDRKGILLSNLPLPDLNEATVVDYGVGSWGFGCIFPKLKDCKSAIGIDVSQYAVDCSRKISQSDPSLVGKKLEFITSTGYEINLEEASVDLVFAGECIEHIEDTESFLSEIWRILKNDGIAIFTTPNEKPFFYKRLGIKWAMGLEHVALMDSNTLIEKLNKYFLIEVTKGYSSTVSPDLDELVDDSKFGVDVAHLCEDAFHDASGLVVQVRKVPNITPYIPKVTHSIVESEYVTAYPNYRDLSLYKDTNGRMAIGDDSYLMISVPESAIRCQVILWSHPWSGIAKIETFSVEKEIDLYSHVSGCTRITLEECDLTGSSSIKVTATGRKNPNSKGAEVIFFRAVFTSLHGTNI